jgi:hypothetical protein
MEFSIELRLRFKFIELRIFCSIKHIIYSTIAVTSLCQGVYLRKLTTAKFPYHMQRLSYHNSAIFVTVHILITPM